MGYFLARFFIPVVVIIFPIFIAVRNIVAGHAASMPLMVSALSICIYWRPIFQMQSHRSDESGLRLGRRLIKWNQIDSISPWSAGKFYGIIEYTLEQGSRRKVMIFTPLKISDFFRVGCAYLDGLNKMLEEHRTQP